MWLVVPYLSIVYCFKHNADGFFLFFLVGGVGGAPGGIKCWWKFDYRLVHYLCLLVNSLLTSSYILLLCRLTGACSLQLTYLWTLLNLFRRYIFLPLRSERVSNWLLKLVLDDTEAAFTYQGTKQAWTWDTLVNFFCIIWCLFLKSKLYCCTMGLLLQISFIVGTFSFGVRLW